MDKYSRVVLPRTLVQRVGWISGDQAVNAWLLLGSPGRTRLLSPTEVDEDGDLQGLRAKITDELNAPSSSVLDFHDEETVAQTLRLVPVQITPPPPGWRFTLPRTIVAIKQIRPGESDLAALFTQDHIEFWTMDTLRSAVTTSLN